MAARDRPLAVLRWSRRATVRRIGRLHPSAALRSRARGGRGARVSKKRRKRRSSRPALFAPKKRRSTERASRDRPPSDAVPSLRDSRRKRSKTNLFTWLLRRPPRSALSSRPHSRSPSFSPLFSISRSSFPSVRFSRASENAISIAVASSASRASATPLPILEIRRRIAKTSLPDRPNCKNFLVPPVFLFFSFFLLFPRRLSCNTILLQLPRRAVLAAKLNANYARK